ncbi:MAG: hypothetical protein CMP48_20120, partial [Rickettsiales bacterium]|nr:hypothetical protein [Rickettsiales bacterium]
MKHFILSAILVASIFLVSCNEDDPIPVPIQVNFSSTELGISESNPFVLVEIVFSRTTESSGELVIEISEDKLIQGATADFFTDLSGENATSLTYSKGVESVAFSVLAGTGLNIEQDESITLTISQVGENQIVGENAELIITFGENFIAESGQATLDAGGTDFTQQAYFDFSKNSQTAVDKYSWDLGFYSGSENRVTVNNSANVMARALDVTDLAAVSAEDTLGFSAVMSVPNYDPSAGASVWIDDQSGDLSLTAFGEISATSDDAKVFIIKRDGEDRNWKKVRVYSTESGYTLEYADIDSEEFNTAEISKNAAFNFVHFDLDNGEVTTIPEKASWDIVYGTYALRYPFGAAAIPYGFKDYILINRNDTQVAVVTELEYSAFAKTDVDGLEFSTSTDAIGAEWRAGGGPTSGPAVYEDRFFVLKDSQGNHYKIQFLSLTDAS